MVSRDRTSSNGHKLKHRNFISKKKKQLSHFKGDRTVKQVVLRSYGISIPGVIQNLTGLGTEKLALIEHSLIRRVELDDLLTSTVL